MLALQFCKNNTQFKNNSQMNKLQILTKPNPLLKQVSKQITFPFNQQTTNNIQLLKNAFRDSFTEKGVRTLGLAAPQLGILQRFFIMPKNINYTGINIRVLKAVVRSFNVYINPRIILHSQNEVMILENCLSIGMDLYEVKRAEKVTVEYFNIQGLRIEQSLSGIRARVFLHENDHLDGITMDQRGILHDKKLTDPEIGFTQAQKL